MSTSPRIQDRIQQAYHEYPQPFWVLMTGTFIDRFGTNLVMPFLAIYVSQHFKVPLTQVGIIFTIFAVTSAVGNMLAGALADRFGRRFTLIMGIVCAATARVGLGLAADLPQLYVAAAFAGLFGAVGWPAQLAMTADLLGPEKRAGGFGIQRVIINSTFALGPMVGALLAPVTGYLLLFILDALTSYFVAFIILTRLPETRPQGRDDAPAASFGQTLAGYGQVLRDGPFVAFILISILTVTAYLQMSTTLSLFLVEVRHLSTTFFGSLVMLNAVMVVTMQIPITRWASKRPMLWMMVLGAALYLVGFGSYGFTTVPALFVVAMVLITLGEMFVIPTSQALTAYLAPADMRARYVALERFNWITAQALGPLAAAAIMDRFDPRWVWYGCGILCAISIVGYVILQTRAHQRLEIKQDQPSYAAAASD